MNVETHRFTDRAEAGAQLQATLHRLFTHPREQLVERIGHLGGFDLEASIDRRMTDDVTIRLAGSPLHVTFERTDLRDTDPVSTITRIERKIRSLEHVRDQARTDGVDARHEAGQAQSRLGTTFEHTDRLHHLVGRQAQIAAELTPPEPAPEAVPPPAPAKVGMVLER